MTRCTCQTEGCGNAGIPLELDLTWVDDAGDTHTVDVVQCGACGEPITDLVPVST